LPSAFYKIFSYNLGGHRIIFSGNSSEFKNESAIKDDSVGYSNKKALAA
jgi:hypothetical protein